MKKYYSHSKLETFEQCPFKFKLQYIDKVPRPDKESIEAFMGNKVHECLKRLYDELKSGRGLALEELLEYFDVLWGKDMSEKVFVVKAGRGTEQYKTAGAAFLGNYFRKHFPFNEDETLDTEQRISFPLDAAGEIMFGGIVDRVSMKNGSTLIIHDYKTSSRLPVSKEIENDRQLTMYQMAVTQKTPSFENVELVWHFLAFDTDIKLVRDGASLMVVKNKVLSLIDKIEAACEFPASEGPLCSWCDYAAQCPAVIKRKSANGGKYEQQELF